MTTTPNLGRISTVQPRTVWPHEAHNFTPWLLENVDVLSDLLGMELELGVAEHPIGGFSLDLLGRDLSDDSVVICHPVTYVNMTLSNHPGATQPLGTIVKCGIAFPQSGQARSLLLWHRRPNGAQRHMPGLHSHHQP
jgi:hypothetical protein